jgi:hypothetical protein
MSSPLFARQSSLLAYLTSGDAIFGRQTGVPAPLSGIDTGLLRLEARFSYEKRVAQIAAVLPRTLALLGEEGQSLFPDFADSHPPQTLASLANARQFVDYLKARWRMEKPEPAYLPDVAAYEIAWSEVHTEEDAVAKPRPLAAPAGAVRRAPNLVLLCLDHDVRPLFEGEPSTIPAARETLIAVAMPAGAEAPLTAELQPAVFDLLSRIESFTDPAALGEVPRLEEMIVTLAAHGLVELSE